MTSKQLIDIRYKASRKLTKKPSYTHADGDESFRLEGTHHSVTVGKRGSVWKYSWFVRYGNGNGVGTMLDGCDNPQASKTLAMKAALHDLNEHLGKDEGGVS